MTTAAPVFAPGWPFRIPRRLVPASEARRNWFRILDEVAAGRTVGLERHGRRIVLRQRGAGRVRLFLDTHFLLWILLDLPRLDAFPWLER